jgi:hypothetical protein
MCLYKFAFLVHVSYICFLKFGNVEVDHFKLQLCAYCIYLNNCKDRETFPFYTMGQNNRSERKKTANCDLRQGETEKENLVETKAVNREDKRSRQYRDRHFTKFDRSRRYRDRYRC